MAVAVLDPVYIGPAEACRIQPGAFRVLHDAVVKGYLGAFTVGPFHEGGLQDVLLPAAEKFRHFRDVLFQLLTNCIGLPDENTAVPEEFTGADKYLGKLL